MGIILRPCSVALITLPDCFLFVEKVQWGTRNKEVVDIVLKNSVILWFHQPLLCGAQWHTLAR